MSKRSQKLESAFRLAERLHLAGRLAEAEQAYRHLLTASPRHPAALHALGALALQTGRPEMAEHLITQAITEKPAAAFQLTRAHALLALRRPADAETASRTLLRAAPQNALGHQVLGHALSDLGDAAGALDAYRHAQRLNPALPDIGNNIGTALRQASRLEEAEQALLAAPLDPGALLNLSSVQKERGAFDRAEATLRRALAQAPNDPALLYNWSLLMLLMGRNDEAWPGWEQRFAAGAIPPLPAEPPQWAGDDLGQRRLLVLPEQGLGDIIQFVRYLPSISGAVTFDAPPKLRHLLASNPAIPLDPLPGYDVSAPLLSLPARMREPPAQPPYLLAQPEREAAWRDRIGEDGVKVGIAWQGFSGRFEDRGRSVPLTAFHPLAKAGVRLISLQKGEGEEQVAGAGFAVETLQGLDDGPDAFVDTAAVMRLLDLIITSDTSIAHLAGALGCRVWVALRLVPDWRWLTGRSDSPWYPSMRLFRQHSDGDWTPVFAAMADALTQAFPR
jgi:tetratricopeptide (TPR) repeat protein